MSILTSDHVRDQERVLVAIRDRKRNSRADDDNQRSSVVSQLKRQNFGLIVGNVLSNASKLFDVLSRIADRIRPTVVLNFNVHGTFPSSSVNFVRSGSPGGLSVDGASEVSA